MSHKYKTSILSTSIRMTMVTASLLTLAACGSSGGGGGDSTTADESQVQPSTQPAGDSTNVPTNVPGQIPSESNGDSDNTNSDNPNLDNPGDSTPGSQPIVETSEPDTTPSQNPPSGSSNQPVNLSGEITQLGVVDLDYSGLFDETSLAAFFVEFPLFPDASLFAADLVPNEDSCEVFDFTSIEDLDIDFDIPDILDQIEPVSAGEVIPFISSAGTYAELQSFEAFGFTLYQLEDEIDSIPGIPPSGLQFSIPGDDFPAFPNVSVPDIVPLEISNPASGATITADTVFTWNAAESSGSRISISLFATSGTVDCTALDDGRFELPADIKQQLGAGVSITGASYSRESLNLLQSGSSVLFVTTSTEATN